MSQPLFCPFGGSWMGKDPLVLWGQVLCAGIWGRQGCEVGPRVQGVGKEFLPSPMFWGFGPGGDLAVPGL